MISMSLRNRHRKPGAKVNIRKKKAEENNLEIITKRNSKADSLNCSVLSNMKFLLEVE